MTWLRKLFKNETVWFVASLDPSLLHYYGLGIAEPFRGDEGDEEDEDDNGDTSQTDGKHYFALST